MPSSDAFDILKLSPRFDLTSAELQSAYLALSASLHPDAASIASPETDEKSSQLNAAKRALEDPESRADLLLLRLGGPAREQDRTLPPGFLAEMLEVREQIESDAASKDPEKIEAWEDWARARRKTHIAEVSRLFKRIESDGASPAFLKSIREELNMWRYIERLTEQLGEAS